MRPGPARRRARPCPGSSRRASWRRGRGRRSEPRTTRAVRTPGRGPPERARARRSPGSSRRAWSPRARGPRAGAAAPAPPRAAARGPRPPAPAAPPDPRRARATAAGLCTTPEFLEAAAPPPRRPRRPAASMRNRYPARCSTPAPARDSRPAPGRAPRPPPRARAAPRARARWPHLRPRQHRPPTRSTTTTLGVRAPPCASCPFSIVWRRASRPSCRSSSAPWRRAWHASTARRRPWCAARARAGGRARPRRRSSVSARGSWRLASLLWCLSCDVLAFGGWRRWRTPAEGDSCANRAVSSCSYVTLKQAKAKTKKRLLALVTH